MDDKEQSASKKRDQKKNRLIVTNCQKFVLGHEHFRFLGILAKQDGAQRPKYDGDVTILI
jgi:hypothetical protein